MRLLEEAARTAAVAALAIVAAVAAVPASGCYSPGATDGCNLRCGPGLECPEGSFCSEADFHCHPEARRDGHERCAELSCEAAADCPAVVGAAAACHCGRCAHEDSSCLGSPGLRYTGAGECVPVPTQIDSYYTHSCTRHSDGSVWCWGWDCSGQLGDQPASLACDAAPVLRARPVRVRASAGGEALGGVERVATGIWHSCALGDDGSVRCWGGGASGQIGSGEPASETPWLEPTEVRSVTGEPLAGMTRLTVGGAHGCALDDGGVAWCWGQNNYGQLGVPGWPPGTDHPEAGRVGGGEVATPLFRDLAAGGEHSCARTRDGGPTDRDLAFCWGRNNLGQLGTSCAPLPAGDPGLVEEKPAQVVTCVGDSPTPFSAYVLGLGNRFSCATRAPGAAFCWGQNARHALGDGSNPTGPDGDTRWFPARVELPSVGSEFDRIDGGDFFACAHNANGDVYCWGANDFGQLGTGSSAAWEPPVLVLEDTRDLAVGFSHACAITSSYEVRCWGDNRHGQLGDGTQTSRDVPTPTAPFCP